MSALEVSPFHGIALEKSKFTHLHTDLRELVLLYVAAKGWITA